MIPAIGYHAFPSDSYISSSKFYFQQNTTMEQYQEKHFVDIRKHIETLLHLSMVTREATGLIKLATNICVGKLGHNWLR